MAIEPKSRARSKRLACDAVPLTLHAALGALSSNQLQLPGLRFRVAVGDGFPVDNTPPGVEVIRALVLILQIIRVLPYVHAHDRRLARQVGAVLIRAREDF